MVLFFASGAKSASNEILAKGYFWGLFHKKSKVIKGVCPSL